MIRKFLHRVLSRTKPDSTAPAGLRIFKLKDHGITRSHISPGALKTASGLQQAGFVAFIVGGAVRDLLLGREPKDFDVATDASPEQVHALFRRSRIIGRRFRLVHVMCGPETVEVSTFRGAAGADEAHETAASVKDEHGRILRDNVFGTQEQDAERRDFTVNALFYDPAEEEIWDYRNGVADLRARRLRIIGDPESRYREDPVRMLRAVRFAAKLGMKIEQATAAPISELAPLLAHVPPSRLFDEMLKLLLSGHSVDCVLDLRARGLHHGLLPMLDVILEQPLGERFVMLALGNTDERIAQDKPVSPGFLFAALLWHEVLASWKARQEAGVQLIPALHEAMDGVLSVQDEKLATPRRYDAVMKEIWAMQPRFLNRSGKRPFRLLEHPRFRAGYDFLQLRCASGEIDAELGQWWNAFQHAGPAERSAMLLQEAAPGKKRRRRRARRQGAEDRGQAAELPEKSTD